MSTHIAKQFLQAIAKKNEGNKIIEKFEHQTHQVPSVIQFRMMGCKGILVHDPTLDNQDPLTLFWSKEGLSDRPRLHIAPFGSQTK